MSKQSRACININTDTFLRLMNRKRRYTDASVSFDKVISDLLDKVEYAEKH